MSLGPDQLHVIRCYLRLPPRPGGMERHVRELTKEQRRLGVRVTEVYHSGEPTGESLRVWRALDLEKLPSATIRWLLFYSALAFRRIDLSDGRYPVLHAHGDWPAFLLATWVGRRMNAAAVAASLHARFHAPVARYVQALAGCDPVFTTGREQSQVLTRAIGREVIHLPSAPMDLFFSEGAARADEADVIAVGSLVPVKNLDLLIECAVLRPDLRFMILGDGPERQRLERLKAERSMTNVAFRHAATPEQVRSALASAKLFLNTSLSEGSPTAALEAMACGLPVVMTPANDYSSIVKPGLNGLVTNGWKADELIGAMSYFLEHPERLAQGAAAARATALEHRWSNKARLVTDAMLAAVERHTGMVQ